MKNKLVFCILLGSLFVYAHDPATMIEKLKGQTMPLGYPSESPTSEMLAHPPKQPNFSPFTLTEFLIDTSRYETYSGMQRHPGVAFDGTNFMAVWVDRYNNRGIVGARIAIDGTILDQGAFIISSSYSNDQPNIVFDGTNYFVVWHNSAFDLYGARITTDGTVLDPDGFLISSYGDCYPAVDYGAGVYLVVWQANHVASAALVDTNGTVLSEFCLADIGDSPDVSFDGTNFLTVWYNGGGVWGSRIAPDGTNLDPGGFNISSGGMIPVPVVDFDGANWFVVWWSNSGFDAAWVTPAGVPFGEFHIEGSYGMWFPEIVLGDSIYWVHGFMGSGNLCDIYATRIDFSGNVLDNPWIPVDTSAGWQAYGGNAYGDSTFIAIWEDQVSWDIYARRYSPDGTPMDSTRFLVNVATNSQRYPGVGFDGTNYMVVYPDNRNEYNQIYGARVTQDGTMLDPGGFPISQGTGGVMYPWPRVAFGDSLYLCVWENFDANIWGARILPDGTVLDPNGLPITSAYYESSIPSVSYSNGIFLVSYSRYAGSYQYSIRATRVMPDGQVLDSSGIIIKPPETTGIPGPMTEVAPYENGFLVTWMSGSNIIEGARVSFQGAVLDSPAIQISPPGVGGQRHGVVSSGDTFFVVWGQGSSEIYGARVDSSGQVLDPAGISICGGQPNSRTQPSVAFNGKDFLVVWQDSRLEPSQYDLFGARVSPTGIVLDTIGIELVNSEYSRGNVELASAAPDPDTGAQVLLVFDGFVGEPYNSNRALGAIFHPPTGIEEGYAQEISTGYRINISPNISCQKPYVLSYSLPALTGIGVNVYDITGRLVKNVYEGNIKGTGGVKFTLAGLPQGIYFVRVDVENKTEVTKVIWLR